MLSPQGLALYYIDLSDHFSHDDHSISAINFLQFSDEQWHLTPAISSRTIIAGAVPSTKRCCATMRFSVGRRESTAAR